MNYRVIIEPSAERGIREAVQWLSANGSPTIAAKWFNGLLRKVANLKTHPARCPSAAENDRFPEEIRELLHGSRRHKYRFLFTIRGDAVHLLYVHHSARGDLLP